MGSSLVKRATALAKLSACFLSLGLIDMEMTGSGTWIDSMESVCDLSKTKLSPEAQSRPKKAHMSPAKACEKFMIQKFEYNYRNEV